MKNYVFEEDAGADCVKGYNFEEDAWDESCKKLRRTDYVQRPDLDQSQLRTDCNQISAQIGTQIGTRLEGMSPVA